MLYTRKIGIGIIACCAIALVAIGIAFSGSAVVTTPNEFPLSNDTSGGNMANIVEAIFDVNNSGTVYDWAITDDTDGIETLIESSIFNVSGTKYQYLLASGKQNPTDELYTVSKYLTLTITTSDEEIVFVDLYTDGLIDSFYINDVVVDDPSILAEAQAQYESALAFSEFSLIAVK